MIVSILVYIMFVMWNVSRIHWLNLLTAKTFWVSCLLEEDSYLNKPISVNLYLVYLYIVLLSIIFLGFYNFQSLTWWSTEYLLCMCGSGYFFYFRNPVYLYIVLLSIIFLGFYIFSQSLTWSLEHLLRMCNSAYFSHFRNPIRSERMKQLHH